MARHTSARSELRGGHSYWPTFNAFHPVVPSDAVSFWMHDADKALQGIIPPTAIFDNNSNCLRERKQYGTADDPTRRRLHLLHTSLVSDIATKYRVKWTHNDRGRVLGEIATAVAKLGMPDHPTEVRFTNVVRLGRNDRDPNSRRLGLIVDQTSSVAEFLVASHDITVSALQRRFPHINSSDGFIPNWPVAYIDGRVDAASRNKCIEAVQATLPFVAQIRPVQFSAEDL